MAGGIREEKGRERKKIVMRAERRKAESRRGGSLEGEPDARRGSGKSGGEPRRRPGPVQQSQ